MSKLISEPVAVYVADGGLRQFVWRRRLYLVGEVLGRWWEPGAWWEGELEREFFRVETTGRRTGIYELCRKGERWLLHRVLD